MPAFAGLCRPLLQTLLLVVFTLRLSVSRVEHTLRPSLSLVAPQGNGDALGPSKSSRQDRADRGVFPQQPEQMSL